jgi:hypothetical protein
MSADDGSEVIERLGIELARARALIRAQADELVSARLRILKLEALLADVREKSAE